MSNRPISKIFNNVPGLNRAVLDLFKDFPGVFLSGSRAFGWATEDSDFDVCVFAGDQKRARELLDRLGGNKTQESEYYNGSKAGGILVKNGGHEFLVTVNIVPLHPLDMLCWWLATREIAHVGRIDGSRLGARETKHGAFEILRGFYKSVIPYQGEEVVRAQLVADQTQARRRLDPVAESLPA